MSNDFFDMIWNSFSNSPMSECSYSIFIWWKRRSRRKKVERVGEDKPMDTTIQMMKTISKSITKRRPNKDVSAKYAVVS